MSGGVQRPTMKHAMTYLKVVKVTLQDEREKYDQFLDIRNIVFNRDRNNTEEVIQRVKELFRGHIGLLFGFNVFLPEGYEIKLPLEDNQQPPLNGPVQTEEALNFLCKIRMTHFEGGVEVYNSFLDILRMYRRGSKPIAEVYWEVVVLFQDHIELIHEFNKFLPTTAQDPVMQLAELIARGLNGQ